MQRLTPVLQRVRCEPENEATTDIYTLRCTGRMTQLPSQGYSIQPQGLPPQTPVSSPNIPQPSHHLHQTQPNHHNHTRPSSPSSLPTTTSRRLYPSLRPITRIRKPITLHLHIRPQTIPKPLHIDHRTVLETTIVRLHSAGAAACQIRERCALRVADAAEEVGGGVEGGRDVRAVEGGGCAVGCDRGKLVGVRGRDGVGQGKYRSCETCL